VSLWSGLIRSVRAWMQQPMVHGGDEPIGDDRMVVVRPGFS